MSPHIKPPKTNGSHRPRRVEVKAAVDVVKAVMLGTGALYLTTGSVIVTAIGAIIAAGLGALHMMVR
ncbi:hypothetical protein H4696_000557 [Amycolatopsis lexingtonensis]|uniref:Uncharacterized protein n=1 Tax=Amycolatopsis lexingtonensis TaxID=218822 RepID=A0ABR9HRA0_9PSEU|nr:hypothetical protein [Amycolatopsis lexingtonensis]